MRRGRFFYSVADKPEDGKKANANLTGNLPCLLLGPIKVSTPASFWRNVDKHRSGSDRQYLDPNTYVDRKPMTGLSN